MTQLATQCPEKWMNLYTKDRIENKHKKDIFQKQKDQNQKPSTPMNFQQTHNALTSQKNVDVYFKDVKTEETISSRPRPDASGNYQICKLQKSASATIVKSVESMIGTTMNSSRLLN